MFRLVLCRSDPELFCTSADWLERNLLRRVETGFPILDPAIATRIREEALDNYLADNLNAWELHADGSYLKVEPRDGDTAPSAQAAPLETGRASCRARGWQDGETSGGAQ